MRGEDVLAYHIVIGRPESGGLDTVQRTVNGYIVDQGIEPDIGDVILIEGKGDAPCKSGFGP